MSFEDFADRFPILGMVTMLLWWCALALMALGSVFVFVRFVKWAWES